MFIAFRYLSDCLPLIKDLAISGIKFTYKLENGYNYVTCDNQSNAAPSHLTYHRDCAKGHCIVNWER